MRGLTGSSRVGGEGVEVTGGVGGAEGDKTTMGPIEGMLIRGGAVVTGAVVTGAVVTGAVVTGAVVTGGESRLSPVAVEETCGACDAGVATL